MGVWAHVGFLLPPRVGSEDQVSRFSWQAPLPTRLSCLPPFPLSQKYCAHLFFVCPSPMGPLVPETAHIYQTDKVQGGAGGRAEDETEVRGTR